MSLQRTLQWLFLAATAALLMFLKWLHIGVTHYNVVLEMASYRRHPL
jgi:succinate dehydrogenase hydrophobic anchor subunit